MNKLGMSLRNVVRVFTCLAVVAVCVSCKKDDAKQITAFSFTTPQAVGEISELAKSIRVNVPAGTDLTALTPTIKVSEKATLSPASGVVQNFTNPVVYTVTAEDGSTAKYTVTVKEGGTGEDGFVVEATNVMFSSGSITTVKAFTWSGYEFATAEYKNSGFKIVFPKSLPDYELEDFIDVFGTPLSLMSDIYAKAIPALLVAFNSHNEEIGEFMHAYGSDDYYVEVYYVYADRDFTVKGTDNSEDYEVVFDCTFKKGWNVLYWIEDDGWDELFTTQKPSSINLRWYFGEWGWDSPSVKSIMQKSTSPKKSKKR